MAGDEFEETAIDELGESAVAQNNDYSADNDKTDGDAGGADDDYSVNPPRELTPEEKLSNAMQMPCPITRYNGKTLGEVLQLDPKAIQWCATKFTGGDEIKAAANLICEYALQATA